MQWSGLSPVRRYAWARSKSQADLPLTCPDLERQTLQPRYRRSGTTTWTKSRPFRASQRGVPHDIRAQRPEQTGKPRKSQCRGPRLPAARRPGTALCSLIRCSHASGGPTAGAYQSSFSLVSVIWCRMMSRSFVWQYRDSSQKARPGCRDKTDGRRKAGDRPSSPVILDPAALRTLTRSMLGERCTPSGTNDLPAHALVQASGGSARTPT